MTGSSRKQARRTPRRGSGVHHPSFLGAHWGPYWWEAPHHRHPMPPTSVKCLLLNTRSSDTGDTTQHWEHGFVHHSRLCAAPLWARSTSRSLHYRPPGHSHWLAAPYVQYSTFLRSSEVLSLGEPPPGVDRPRGAFLGKERKQADEFHGWQICIDGSPTSWLPT